jgi:hypothetical protein
VVTLINRFTKTLDSWSYRYPARVFIFMLVLALLVMAVANTDFMRGAA